MEDIASSVEKKGSYVPVLLIFIATIISISVTLSFLHLLYIKYCKRRHDDHRPLTFSFEPLTIGLDRRTLNAIPILFYSAKTRDLYRISQEDQCVICLGMLDKGDLIRWLPNCGHVFHVPCIDHWFLAHSNCPICRRAPSYPMHRHFSMQNFDVEASDCGRGDCGGDNVRIKFDDMVCNYTKLVLPIEGLRSKDLIRASLNRSFSMDQSFVIVDMKERNGASTSYHSNPQSKVDFLLSRLYEDQLTRHLDLMSSMAPRSLHGFMAGRGGSSRSCGILPY